MRFCDQGVVGGRLITSLADLLDPDQWIVSGKISRIFLGQPAKK
jgi:hypothetical protein